MSRAEQAEQTRTRILDAARDLVARQGVSASGLKEVIAAAEITKGAFYHHFDSKDAMLAVLIALANDTIQNEWVPSLTETSDPVDWMISRVDDEDVLYPESLIRALCNDAHLLSDSTRQSLKDLLTEWQDALARLLRGHNAVTLTLNEIQTAQALVLLMLGEECLRQIDLPANAAEILSLLLQGSMSDAPIRPPRTLDTSKTFMFGG